MNVMGRKNLVSRYGRQAYRAVRHRVALTSGEKGDDLSRLKLLVVSLWDNSLVARSFSAGIDMGTGLAVPSGRFTGFACRIRAGCVPASEASRWDAPILR